MTQDRRTRILQNWGYGMSIVGFGIALLSCGSAYFCPANNTLRLINAFVWTVLPPLWFFFEYKVLFKNYGRPEEIVDLKYGQGLATKFWAGVGAFLAIIYKVV